MRGYLTYEQVELLAQKISVWPSPKKDGTIQLRGRPMNGDIVRFLSYTGLRFGEMAGLKVGSVDLVRNRLSVVEAVAEVHGKIVWSSPKNRKSRPVAYPEKLLGPMMERMTEGKRLGDLLFEGERGGVVAVNTWRRRHFIRAVARCQDVDLKFPTITPHDLRHTAASLAISAGANPKVVQRMLGHSSAAMTLDTYADLFDEDLDGVAQAMDRASSRALSALPAVDLTDVIPENLEPLDADSGTDEDDDDD